MLITHKHLSKNFEYDGSQIEASWAFKSFKIKGSAIITWIGSMNIKPDNLKDFEDIGLEIKSDNMVHFMLEHFDEQPANLRIGYLRQRLLVMILKEELANKGIFSSREGDDIYIDSKKLTVSIATVSSSSMKIHLGINITSDGTPDDVDTIGLFELNNKIANSNSKEYFNYSNLLIFINDIVNNYINELNSIELDISKTNLL
ncbi:hypothetical protein MBCUT_01210 [Methanobrevibacter cuticularis]|uniref:DUF366 domain-containing protein n=1 Tax=Methanobrevibacter cuticularis TaxID=47311 RepID=A0A166FG92_9EURY|nr:DUF366 family protein [Methanobrevibacter cuticularis]KZX17643.1 hypothetical protein MBCUT_01210 [Methanobrevibacter cuticularis]